MADVQGQLEPEFDEPAVERAVVPAPASTPEVTEVPTSAPTPRRRRVRRIATAGVASGRLVSAKSTAVMTAAPPATQVGDVDGDVISPEESAGGIAAALREASDAELAAVIAEAERYVREARMLGVELSIAGVAPIPSGVEVRRVAAEDEWLVATAEDDPLARRNGAMALPDEIQRRVETLDEAGLGFSTVLFAHELGTGSGATPSDVVAADASVVSKHEGSQRLADPSLHPDAAKRADRVERTARGVNRGLAATVAGVGIAAALVAGGALLGPIAAAAAAPAAVADPIIFGAVVAPGHGHTPGTLAAWITIGSWDW